MGMVGMPVQTRKCWVRNTLLGGFFGAAHFHTPFLLLLYSYAILHATYLHYEMYNDELEEIAMCSRYRRMSRGEVGHL